MTVNKKLIAILVFVLVVSSCLTFLYVRSLEEERDQLKQTYEELYKAYSDLDIERIELMVSYADEIDKVTEDNDQAYEDVKNVIMKALDFGYAETNRDIDSIKDLLSSNIRLIYLKGEPYLNYKVDDNDIATRLFETFEFDFNELYVTDYSIENESIMVTIKRVGKEINMDADVQYFQELVFKNENGNWLIHHFGDQIIKSVVVFSSP